MERAERLFLSFFAAPTNGASAAFFRVTLGLLACWQCFGVWLNLERFWGDDGLIPYGIVAADKYQFLTPFFWAPESKTVLYAHGVAFTVASVALLVGFFPRVFTLLLAYVHLSLQFRNPFILNSGDRLFMIVAALAVAVPLGHRFSVDALIRKLRKRAAPMANVWGLRLLQIQLAYVYLNSTLAKLGNTRWRTGMALRDVLASPVFAEWPTYVDFTPAIWFLTYSTLVFELAFPLFIWFRRARPWLLAYGVLFHAGIDSLMLIPIFSWIMIATYPACLDDADMAALGRFFGRLVRRAPKAADEGKVKEAAPAGG
jgi:uncharacterized membrane protein YphA (DoxX/SURF4 family)